MSHDRGCGDCGRDRGEYDACVEKNCIKRKNTMEDTDWRPSPCPQCGEMREAARNPVCRNVDCVNDVAKRHLRTMKTEKYYIWSKQGKSLVMLDDLQWLFKNPEFDSKDDKIYELGPEVKIEMTIKVTPAKPVYRENASGYRVPFENRD
jgi:hypothetical protein